MIETSSGLPLKSSVIFGNLRVSSKNVRQRSCDLWTSFGESSESGRESSENRQKRRHQCVYIIKKNITR